MESTLWVGEICRTVNVLPGMTALGAPVCVAHDAIPFFSVPTPTLR